MQLGSSLRRRRSQARPGTGRAPRSEADRDPGGDPGRFALLVVLVSVVALGFGYLGATHVLFPAPAPPPDLVKVPDVRGELLAEARASFEDAGLQVAEVEELRHPQADSGSVVGQAPLPGQLASRGDSVRLTVSLGPERRRVPEVTGLRADRALTVLESTGLLVQVDSVEDNHPRGRIIQVAPEEGTEVTLPGSVTVTVSLGPPEVEVPALLGLSEAEARDSLDALGLTVSDVEEVFRFGRDQGRVVGQEPPAGTRLERGDSVRLTVGRRGG